MPVHLIMACDQAGFIADAQNQLPWKLSADLQHFKQKTLHRTVIMGKQTLESLPPPWNTAGLPLRKNLVLSSSYQGPLERLASLPELRSLLAQSPQHSFWVIGGASVANQILLEEPTLLSSIWLTLVQGPALTEGVQLKPSFRHPSGDFRPPVAVQDENNWGIRSVSHNPAPVSGPNDRSFSIIHWVRHTA